MVADDPICRVLMTLTKKRNFPRYRSWLLKNVPPSSLNLIKSWPVALIETPLLVWSWGHAPLIEEGQSQAHAVTRMRHDFHRDFCFSPPPAEWAAKSCSNNWNPLFLFLSAICHISLSALIPSSPVWVWTRIFFLRGWPPALMNFDNCFFPFYGLGKWRKMGASVAAAKEQ